MATINPSDRSNNDDQVRKTRETYQKNETEEAKKNANRVRQLNEAHQAEIQAIKDDHAKQLEDLKTSTRESLSRRDMQYQKEIDDMRDMHNKQLQRVAVESEGRQDRNEGALKGEIEHLKKTTDQQKEGLKKTFDSELSQRDANFNEYAQKAREASQHDAVDIKEKLTKVHGLEMKETIDADNDRLQTQQKFSESLRNAKDQQLRDMGRSHETEKTRLYSDNMNNLKNAQENNRQFQDSQREQYAHNMSQIRDRYEKAAGANGSEAARAREELSDTVNGRVNNEVRMLSTENQNLKTQQVRDRVRSDQQKQRELADLRQSMGANIENLEASRRDTVEASNERTKQDIDKVNKANTETVHSNNKFFQEKISMDELRTEERFDREKADSTRMLSQEKNSSDNRFGKMKSFNELEQSKMRSYFERATTSMKENFETSLREMRDRNKHEQEQLFSQFTKNAQDNDSKFQQKLGDVSLKYEKQMAEMHEDHLKEMKDQQALAERQRKEVEKKGDLDVKTQASQTQYRLGKLEETHKREMDSLQRKHEEALANLTKSRQS